MKITQPNNMAVSLRMSSQHICIVCWFPGEAGLNYQMQIVTTKLPNENI